jgi:hypothetical protein
MFARAMARAGLNEAPPFGIGMSYPSRSFDAGGL